MRKRLSVNKNRKSFGYLSIQKECWKLNIKKENGHNYGAEGLIRKYFGDILKHQKESDCDKK